MYRVYVAGKLSDMPVGYIKNMHTMLRHADIIRRARFAPFTPCLDILLGLVAGNMELQDYYNIGLSWLSVADAVFVIPNSGDSKGTRQEIERAEELGIPVFYTIHELEAWRDKKYGV